MSQARKVMLCTAACAVVALGIVYYYFDPSSPVVPFPRCLFKMLTGLSCPGCGMQRAAHALLHGDVMGALRYNASIPVSVPIVALYLVVEVRGNAWPRLYNALNGRTAIIALIIYAVAWMVLRNVLRI